MSTTLPAWPPALPADQLSHLTSLALDYALSHGLIYRPPYPSPSSFPHVPLSASAISAPISLFPSPFPRELYGKALGVQEIYNELYARVTVDERWLEEVVKACFWGEDGGDSFMRELWKGWKKVKEQGIEQPLHLLLARSDYLVHQSQNSNEPLSIKQVEFNTISSSFGSLSEKVAALHKYLSQQTGYFDASPSLKPENLPANSPIKGLANGLAVAHKQIALAGSDILMVVQDGERNAFDQRWLEYELLEAHGIRSHRASLQTLASAARVDPSTSNLLFTPPHSTTAIPISVVYYRAGYTPDDYPDASLYAVRSKLEGSTAIKCPTYALQLAGSKKVQQVLARPGVLEYFLPTSSDASDVSPAAKVPGARVFTQAEVDELRESFMGLWPLGDGGAESEEGERLVRESDGGEGYVLKPQREGGGNNVYNKDIGPFLAELEKHDKLLPSTEPPSKSAYILMSLITPPPHLANILVRSIAPPAGASPAEDHSREEKEVISELGVYGAVLFGQNEGVVFNDGKVGTLLRTKGRESDEGGVAVGFSVLDSIVLV